MANKMIRWRNGITIFTKVLSVSFLFFLFLGSAYGQRVTEGLTVLYTFGEGQGETVNDVSGVGDPLNLMIEDPSAVVWGDGFLEVVSPTIIFTDEFADKIYNPIVESNEIAIEAFIKPANLEQAGPARIVTFSQDGSNRNFTLGQDGSPRGTLPSDSFEIRLRTSETNANGSSPRVNIPSTVLTTEDITHVVYTRDVDGFVDVYVNNELLVTQTIIGDFSNWNPGYFFGLANEFNDDTGSRVWLGEFHLVAIYSKWLSGDEVTQNFNAFQDTHVNEWTLF